MTIVGIELVAVVSLLLWVVLRPTTTETPKTPSQVTQTLKPPKVELQLVVKGLGVPTAITGSPDTSDKRLFVAERHGLVHILDQEKVTDKPFLDLTAKANDDGAERGLLGFAFHPKFATNGYFYVNYVDKDNNTIIARYQTDTATGLANPNSEKVLIKLKQPYVNHKGGQLAFGPDGYLYAGLGDGGSGGDPENRAQDKTLFFGKILRLDVDHGDPYAVPADNPFVKETGTKPEIWAYGLRNPWRFSFDSKTGDLYIGDVGQNLHEEVDFQAANSKGGTNYGWRCYEATQTYNAAGCQAASAYTMPVLSYDHTDKRCSITGGQVYRGQQYPALLGMYFYADNCGGQVYDTKKSTGDWQANLAVQTELLPTTFGTDNQGEVYLGDMKEGGIYRLIDTANTAKGE